LVKFIRDVKEALKRTGISKITVKNYPTSYFPLLTNRLELALSEAGFIKSISENTACILVDQVEYVKKLQETQRWRLNKAHKQQFKFELLSISNWNLVYDFIKKCRDEKSYTLSMSSEEVGAIVKEFPDRMLLPVVFADDKIIAAALCIKVYDHVLYTFYYDHDSEFNAHSPVIMLMEGLYTYCRTHSISVIDLGTAMVNGEEKKSLMDFKLSLGANLFQKNSYEIRL
jgi:predicted N-acyltransferase